MKHTLLPRATGMQFMLSELRETVDYVYDCTIAYEGVKHGEYAQDIYTLGASYFNGKPPRSVNMYWRRFKTNTIPIDDPKKFELWLRMRWREKDKFIDHYLQYGKFPADTGSNHNFKGDLVHGAGHIEAEIRPKYWYEFLQVFAPISVLALVLYFIYGALPQEMVDNVNSKDNQKALVEHLKAIQRGERKVPQTTDLLAAAPKDVQEKVQAFQTLTNTQLPFSKPVSNPRKAIGKKSPKPLKKTSYSPTALARASHVANVVADAQKQQIKLGLPPTASSETLEKKTLPIKKTGLQKLGPSALSTKDGELSNPKPKSSKPATASSNPVKSQSIKTPTNTQMKKAVAPKPKSGSRAPQVGSSKSGKPQKPVK